MRAGALPALLGLVALAACSPGAPSRPPCPTHQLCLEYGNSSDPVSLDPAKTSLTTESTILRDVLVGLVADGQDGRPIPGVAERWETSPDGLVWTFHLRHSRWSDGEPVTADDFVFAYRRMLEPNTASPYAYMLYLLKNGEAVNAGKAPPSALGVQALDPQTLVLTLEHPAPYLPQVLKHTSMYPVPRHAVQRWGEAWSDPAHYVANGAYRPSSWKLGDHVTVVRNPSFYDADKLCIDRIDYYPTNDAISAERRIARGELDLNTSIQSNRVPYLRQPGHVPAFVRIHTYLATTYVIFNGRDVPALKDLRVRQALSMAIDREFITGKLLRAGQSPAYVFVPPGTADYPGSPLPAWAGWSLARRQAEARRLLAAAGYGPRRPLHIELKLFNTSDPMLISPAIQADWKSVGVQAELIQNETQIAYDSYRNRDFQVALAAWVGDYNDAMSFLGLFQSATGAQNYGDYKNPAYDAVLAQADHEPDLQRRGAYLAKAEQMVLADAAIAPLYFTVNRNLVRPDLSGWTDNLLDIHPSRYLCLPRPDGGRSSGPGAPGSSAGRPPS